LCRGRTMAEDRELLESLRRALEATRRMLEAVGLVWGAYSYIPWLIPLSITVILTSLAPLQRPVLVYIVDALWIVSIVVIVSAAYVRMHKRMASLRRLGLDVAYHPRASHRVVAVGWGLCWIWFPIISFLKLPIPPSVAPPLSLLAALATGVTVNAVWEYRAFRSWISFVAAFILYAVIALLLTVPTTTPWGVACGGISLSYVTAVALYIHEALKHMTSVREQG